ncbi:MAG: hypothetical protein HUN05_19740 [Desulfobacter sp.]|nr:MAG: hypothetical protein HUN05_19740 [Desulfobacter sp.]
MGRVNKSIKSNLFSQAVNFSRNTRIDHPDEKARLAAKAYMNAFSNQNRALKFLSLVTCLEILADRKEKNKVFKNVVDSSIEMIKKIVVSNQEEKEAIRECSEFCVTVSVPGSASAPAEVKVRSENGPSISHVGGVDFCWSGVPGTIFSICK